MKKPRKIPVVHIHGGRILCGAATHILTLLEYLDRDIFEPHLVLLHDGQMTQTARARGLTPYVLRPRFPGDPAAIWRLHRLMRQRAVQAVHTHTLNGNFYGRLAALLSPRPRIITSVHTFMNEAVADFCPSKMRRAFLLWQDRAVRRLATLIVTPSEGVKRFLCKQGTPCTKIAVIYNGIHVSADDGDPGQRAALRSLWNIGPKTFLIGVAGRLVQQKNIGTLLKAVRILQTTGLDPYLMIIGDGPERDRLESQAAELGLHERTTFTGWQPNARSLMNALDLYVLPSLEENFPYSVLEAMAASKPVVAFDSGSLAEMIEHGVTGFLVAPASAHDLALAIQIIMTQQDLASRMGRAGRRRVKERFRADVMTRQMERIYLHVLSADATSSTARVSGHT